MGAPWEYNGQQQHNLPAAEIWDCQSDRVPSQEQGFGYLHRSRINFRSRRPKHTLVVHTRGNAGWMTEKGSNRKTLALSTAQTVGSPHTSSLVKLFYEKDKTIRSEQSVRILNCTDYTLLSTVLVLKLPGPSSLTL